MNRWHVDQLRQLIERWKLEVLEPLRLFFKLIWVFNQTSNSAPFWPSPCRWELKGRVTQSCKNDYPQTLAKTRNVPLVSTGLFAGADVISNVAPLTIKEPRP
jgi:hypothetical protein